ncbi:MAG: sigma-70 family RNA polymerase sigma factor [Kangiellaceae bacterium]|nr:sigma-70 family RNA polymerase sigma factor [Kangiellaceae bacterium]
MGVAYRILGSVVDAEDAVQETFIKWNKAIHIEIENPKAWLTKVCTRCALDLIRANQRSRVEYVGAWLPEPIQCEQSSNDIDNIELSSSLTTAFLLMLERLKPNERAAYLLREIFDLPYEEVADTLNVNQVHCRKLVSRARQNIDKSNKRHIAPIAQQQELLNAFRTAVENRDASQLKSFLTADIQLQADGGGKAPAIIKPVIGLEKVIRFITKKLALYWSGQKLESTIINNTLGLKIINEGQVTASVSFELTERGALENIFIIRNPDKLQRLGTVLLH